MKLEKPEHPACWWVKPDGAAEMVEPDAEPECVRSLSGGPWMPVEGIAGHFERIERFDVIRDRRPTRAEVEASLVHEIWGRKAAKWLSVTSYGLHLHTFSEGACYGDTYVGQGPMSGGDECRGQDAPGEIWRPLHPDGSGMRLDVAAAVKECLNGHGQFGAHDTQCYYCKAVLTLRPA